MRVKSVYQSLVSWCPWGWVQELTYLESPLLVGLGICLALRMDLKKYGSKLVGSKRGSKRWNKALEVYM